MTVKECYEQIGGNYAEAMGRFRTEERIITFFKLYISDPSLNELNQAFAQKDYSAAFIAAHTLKGVLGNMAFTELNVIVSELTEYLRDGRDISAANELYPIVSKRAEEHNKIIYDFVNEQ